MEKLLTIVIPTYNMQDFLNRCLNSLVLDTELMRMIEVLVINDGSKDNSSAIAYEFQERYPGTFRVIDKENGNYGSCVNRGLSEASGKYIKVLDADDWFDRDEFARYLADLALVDVDLVLTPYRMVDENGVRGNVILDDVPVGTVLDFNSCESSAMVWYTMHMVTYRTDLLREMDYQQTEGISYTDNEWTHIPQYRVGHFVYFPHLVYQYLQGRDGQTMSTDSLLKNVWNFEQVCISLVENMKNNTGKGLALADKANLHEVIHSASFVYRLNLVKGNPFADELEHLKRFDAYLKESCPEAYAETGKLRINKYLPVYYVRFWRMTGRRFPVSWLRNLYDRKHKKI